MNFTTPKKALSRESTYVSAYRQLTGRQSIPTDRQHISLLADLSGAPLEEPRHLSEIGFAQSRQIVGIEHNPTVYAAQTASNEQHYGSELTLHQGDAIDVLERLAREGALRPATVNLDLMCGAAVGLMTLVRALNILSECPPTILVSWNVILRNRVKTQFTEDYWNAARSDPRLAMACRKRWEPLLPHIDYLGSPETIMRTAMFWMA